MRPCPYCGTPMDRTPEDDVDFALHWSCPAGCGGAYEVDVDQFMPNQRKRFEAYAESINLGALSPLDVSAHFGSLQPLTDEAAARWPRTQD